MSPALLGFSQPLRVPMAFSRVGRPPPTRGVLMTSRTAPGAMTPTGEGGAGKPVRRHRRRRPLAVLLAACFAVWLSAGPGIAAAAPWGVSPHLDCYREEPDGTYTVVFGYTDNNRGTTTIELGARNALYPSSYQGSQPTKFLPGARGGVFSLRVSAADLAGDARWVLDGETLDYGALGSAPRCAPATPLPALGNGAGIAAVLAASGAFGVFFVRRLIRRSAADT